MRIDGTLRLIPTPMIRVIEIRRRWGKLRVLVETNVPSEEYGSPQRVWLRVGDELLMNSKVEIS